MATVSEAIAIPAEALAHVYAHARADYPAECCGYLIGPPGGAAVDGAIACTNAHADADLPLLRGRGPDAGFAIGGRELIAFARSFDGPRPARVVYHSHTNGRAYFSATDAELAGDAYGPAYPVQHLVVGVERGAVTECAQFAWSTEAAAYVEIARWAAEAL